MDAPPHGPSRRPAGLGVRGAVAVLVLALGCHAAPAAEGKRGLPILPGAHGFGINTPAGSGRHVDPPKTRIFRVTNLNPNGPGSLREALEAEGPRTVVFEVSGNIEMVGAVSIKHPYLTVAGQTAPSPGITLTRCELNVRASDVLLQHIRIRVGDLRDPSRPERDPKSGWTQWSERDNMKIGGDRVVVDHCTFSWATDENVQSRGSDVTFRQCIFSEGLNSPKHHKGVHSKGLLLLDQSPPDRLVPEAQRESRRVAVVGNLFAHNADRNPMASGGATVVIVNNYIYNATSKPGCGITLVNPPRRGSRGGPILASVIGNCFDRVPAPIRFIATGDENGKVFLDDLWLVQTPSEVRRHEELIKKTVDLRQLQDYRGQTTRPASQHAEAVCRRIKDPWTAPGMLIFRHWMNRRIHPERSKVTRAPIAVPGLKILPGYGVRNWVLTVAGARPADRDAVDRRVIQSVLDRSGRILKSQADVGGWPKLAENRRKAAIPPNPLADDDRDGYTNLEEWLHRRARAVETGVAGSPLPPRQ